MKPAPYLRPARRLWWLLLLGVLIGVGLLSGPARFGPGGRSAEAALLTEVRKILPRVAGPGDNFGWSVAVSGDTAILGAPDPVYPSSLPGAAYVFQRDEGGADNWGEVKKLAASDGEAGDDFGFSVAASGDTAVVGARLEEAGAAYAFHEPAPTPTPTSTLTDTPTATATDTPTPTPTSTPTAAPTSTPTHGDTPTVTFTPRSTPTGPPTNTPAPTDTPTDTPADTPTPTETPAMPPGSFPGPIGDVNCDGIMNSIDAALVLQFEAEFLDTLPCPDAADVNETGRISSIDAELILQFDAGLIDTLPPPSTAAWGWVARIRSWLPW